MRATSRAQSRQSYSLVRAILLAGLGWMTCLAGVLPSIHAQTALGNVAAGANPSAIAVNPRTRQVYVANSAGNTVTVLDGPSHAVAATDRTGTNPVAIAVDPVSNQIFVANFGSNTVSAIDGTTNTVGSTMAVGQAPYAIAINPATQQIYVANSSSNTVSIIDGKTLTVLATLEVGTNPVAITVNPVTNQVYVANKGSSTVTVIDGANRNVAATVSTGEDPVAITVNPVSDLVYVANVGDQSVTVMDGATQAVVATVSTGTSPSAIAVDPLLNQIYVANMNSGNLTIIDGATNASTTVGVGSGPQAIAVNPITNLIYVANILDASVTTIDGSTHRVTDTVRTGLKPAAIAVDLATNRIYVANNGSGNVTVIDGAVRTLGPARRPRMQPAYGVDGSHGDGRKIAQSVAATIPLSIRIAAVSDRQTLATTPVFKTANGTPGFTVTATSNYANSTPYSSVAVTSNPPPTAVYFQLDTLNGPWTAARLNSYSGANPSNFNIALSRPLSLGRHILYVFAAYGGEGTPESGGNGTGNSPEIGNPKRLLFYVEPVPTAIALTTDAAPNGGTYTASLGSAVSFTASVRTAVTGAGVSTGQVAFYDGKKLLGTKDLASGSTYKTRDLTPGTHAISSHFEVRGKSKYLTSSSNVLMLNVVGPSSENSRSTSH
ncbi:MAG: YVTN family beta-propeller repeat protein [Acidobacteriaceae bacterium]